MRSYLSLSLALGVFALVFGSAAVHAQVPFDFSDKFYIQNGLDPTKFDSRISPDDPNATWSRRPGPQFNNTRILEANGGFDAAGQLLYYPAPPANFSAQAFLPNEAGEQARAIANEFRAFIFPKRDGNPTGPPVDNRRHDNVFDTSSGYLTDNPLGCVTGHR